MPAYVPFSNRHRLPRTPRATLWRYVSVEWLVWMLAERQLWVPRADQLLAIDPLEGSLSDDEAAAHAARRMQPDALAEFPALPRYLANQLEHYAVSSWYAAGGESLAMWRLYRGRVAIKTNFERLQQALTTDHRGYYYQYGMVEYEKVRRASAWHADVTPAYPHLDIQRLLFRKDLSLRHEREFRMLLIRESNEHTAFPEVGVPVAIDPAILIQQVVVSPDAQPWELKAIQALLAAWIPDGRVRPSIFSLSPPLKSLAGTYDDPNGDTYRPGARA